MMYRLIVLSGPLNGQRITVEKEPMTLGRDPSCQLVLDDEEIALRHAVLEQSGAVLIVRDLGSMNRVLVNKREVREAKLKHGDIFELGRTRFLVQALVQAEVQESAPEVDVTRTPVAGPLIGIIAILLATIGAYTWWLRGGTEPVDDFASTPNRISVSNENPATAAEPVITISADPVPDAGTSDIYDESAVGAEGAISTDITVADVSSEETVSVGLPLSEPVSDEIRSMREELASLRETMLTLASREPEPRSEVLVAPRIVDTLRQKTEELLAEARKAMSESRWIDAEQMLANIQVVDPDFIEAFVTRAELYEQRGMLKRAQEQWNLVEERSGDASLVQRAFAERIRLAKAEAQAGASRHVMIASVEQQKFPESEEYDEMRLLQITLRQAEGAMQIDPDAVRIEVAFFDEDPTSGEIQLSRVEVPRSSVKLEGTWNEGSESTVTAAYMVPKGFRAREAGDGRQGQYHGYVVGVYYHDALQDEDARPRTLLFRQASDELGRSIGGRTNKSEKSPDDRES